MGCDIHIYAEVLEHAWDREASDFASNPRRVPTQWVPADPWGLPEAPQNVKQFPREISDPANAGDTVVEIDYITVPYNFRVYEGRNYAFFAALNDVRNYDHVPPYFGEGRDLPEDMSPWLRREHEKWGSDAHSSCWATLKELKEMRAELAKMTADAWGVMFQREFDAMVAAGQIKVLTTLTPSAARSVAESLGDKPTQVVRIDKSPPSYARGAGPGPIVEAQWQESMLDYIGGALDELIGNLERRRDKYLWYLQSGTAVNDKELLAKQDELVRAIWWYDN